MARYRRYRRTIIRAPKKKWGSNLINVDMTISNTESVPGNGFYVVTLAGNKTEANAPTPVVIKTGNFKLQGDLYMTNSSLSAVTPSIKCYIVFVPQGMVPTSYEAANALIQNHPEWIISWRVLESSRAVANAAMDSSKFSMSSRLKRNLNSGDSVYCILTVEGIPASSNLILHAMCQFWTCAN